MALQPRWNPSELNPGYFLGYGVDGGEGCFLDEWTQSRLPKDQSAYMNAFTKAMQTQSETFVKLRSNQSDPKFQASWKDAWMGMLDAYRLIEPPELAEMFASRFTPPAFGGRFSSAIIDDQSGANIVRFQSGEGDGCYASYFGLAADGAPACLVTDFGLLIRSVMTTIKVPVPQANKGKLSDPRLGRAGINGIRFEWKSKSGEITFQLDEALYVQDVSFENRPGDKARIKAVGGNSVWYFQLDEPLANTAHLLIEYTGKTVAL